MSTFLSAGARIVHESEFVTEYDDGTEEVRFSKEEWDIMQHDPRFGYIRTCGHPATASLSDGSCAICEAAMSESQSQPTPEPDLVPALDLEPQTPEVNPDEIPF